MALTQIADVIIPEIVAPEVALKIMEKSAFFGSGVVTTDAKIEAFCKSNVGKDIDLGRYEHIADADPNVSSDAATTATPQKNSMIEVIALKLFFNNGWSHASLVNALASKKPNEVVAAQLGDYWAQVWDKVAVADVLGLYLDNVANDDSDMTNDIGNDVDSVPAAAEKFSAEAVIDTQLTSGDNMETYGAMVMHSVVYANAKKLNLIETVRDSDGLNPISYYGQMRVIVSDRTTVIEGTYRNKYITALVGQDAFRYGDGAPDVPIAIERKEDQGTGEGTETLWSRSHGILTPTNYSWDKTNAVVAGNSPTLAEIGVATSWTRTVSRKDVKLAFLVTNG